MELQLIILSSLLGLSLSAAVNSYNKADEYKVEGYSAGGYSSGGYHASTKDNKHDDYPKADPYGQDKYGGDDYQKQIYRGKYPGKCAKDGLYYNNEYAFIICSNNNAYEQKCAPGSRNSGYDKYAHGDTYQFHDFCDINLVNEGYNLHQGGYGSNYPAPKGYDTGSYAYGGSRDGYTGGYQSGYNRGDYRGDYHRGGDYRPYH